MPGCGVTFAPGAHQSVDDHFIIRREAGADDPEPIIGDRTGSHDLGHDGTVSRNRHDQLARLVGDQRSVGHEDRFVLLGARYADAAELARGQKVIGIGKFRANPDSPGATVDLVVDKIEDALARPLGLIGEAHLDYRRIAAQLAELAAASGALESEKIVLAHFEIEPDRVQ